MASCAKFTLIGRLGQLASLRLGMVDTPVCPGDRRLGRRSMRWRLAWTNAKSLCQLIKEDNWQYLMMFAIFYICLFLCYFTFLRLGLLCLPFLFVCLFVCLFVETGFLCVALAVLELTL